MRLQAVDRDDSVGLGDVGVEVGHRAVWHTAELDGVHGRPDGHADRLLGDPEALEKLHLTLDGGTAVGPHGGYDEGIGAQRSQPLTGRAHDLGLVVDAAAAGSQRHPHAHGNLVAERLEGLLGGGGDVVHLGRT